jgi:hypothetical protein
VSGAGILEYSMGRHFSRPLVIALLAVLQLVLQPMLATAGCAVGLSAGGGDCCCRAPEGPPLPESCCSSTAEAAVPDDAPYVVDGCGCSAQPDSMPATLPEAQVLPAGDADAVEREEPAERRWSPAAVYVEVPWAPRARGPGVGRPLRLLTRVFRL